ncbi:MAG: hypothetical protein HWD85_04415 [Flavobacteriaceae bacterium]|nr:hypothetical protein [Flavobacteriaceae bacterium]
MKRLFFFFLISNAIFSQTNNALVKQRVSYTSIDGYTISNPLSLVYDQNGWLWILGENKLSSEFVFGEKEIILQRFDGNNFFTHKIPFTFKNKITKGALFRNSKGGLYLKFWFNNFSKAQLFFIDTKTLEIKRVLAYDKLLKNRHTDNPYHLNNKTRILVTHEEKLFSAELDGLQIKMLDSITYDKPNKSLFIKDINTFGNHVIVKLLSNEFFLLNKHGKFLKMLTKNDFIDVNGNAFLPTMIYSNFTIEGAHYFYFDAKYNLIKYNSKTGKFEEQINSKRNNRKTYTSPVAQEENKIAFLNKANKDFEVTIFDIVGKTYQLKEQIRAENIPVISYRKLSRDLAVAYENKLDIYFFSASKIQTFLKGRSVRAINQLTENKFIIATDNEGFYEVDVKKKEEKEIHFLYNNKAHFIEYSRDIILQDSMLITNDLSNVYVIDKNYTILSKEDTKHPSVEFMKVGDTVFTAGQYGKIFKHSLKGKTTTEVKNTKDVFVKEFTTDRKKVFATTSKGLLKYEKGESHFYEFDNVKTENLLSIKHTNAYGVLVATKFGNIYQFDEKRNTLNLFYKDSLKTSIVGMVEDNDKLWLNTYSGIVCYNPKEKQVKRYTKKDGVYELEGNRFSTFKDNKGNIFIGSYKGVSFFNPKELEESKLKLDPIFSSISSYNLEDEKWTTVTAPSKLKETKELVLPASNQRFNAQVSVLGIVNPNDVKFRYRLVENSTDSNWIRLYNRNEIIFSHLAAGEYTLQVEALTLTNQKIGNTLELRVISKLIFYKTWWFALSLLLLFLAIITYIAYQFKQQQKLYASNKIALNEARIKEAMMLEIHHRIKNNLQVVSGLLSIQAFNSDNDELKAKLQDSQSRIESIAGIHNILYNSDDQEAVFVEEYFTRIVNYNKTLFPINVRYRTNIVSVKLQMDKAIPLALILNELINNSHKHAFKKQDTPEISIGLTEEQKHYVFTYSDNGIFIESTNSNVSMGMKIVKMMIAQLKGNFTIEKANSFSLTIQIPKE